MDKHRFQITDRHRRILAAASLIIFLAFCTLVGYFIGRPMIRFVAQPEHFRAWVDSHGPFGSLLFVGMVVLQVIVALIPGEPLEIGAGYAFGFWEGTLLCLAGIALGSAAVFLLVRRFGVKFVEIFFSGRQLRSLEFLKNERRRDLLFFLMMFIPGTPKDLLSYFVGLTDISIRRWLLITTVARLPSLVSSTIGGDAVGEQRYLFAVITFAVTILISIFGVILYRKMGSKDENTNH